MWQIARQFLEDIVVLGKLAHVTCDLMWQIARQFLEDIVMLG